MVVTEKELEEWKEKCHHLTLKLNSVLESSKIELEFHKDEVIAKQKELSALEEALKADFKAREKKLLEQVNDLTEYLQESRDEGNVLKGQVEQLQRTVEHLKVAQNDKHVRNEQSESAKIREEQLAQELKSSRQLLESQQSKVHTLSRLSEQQKDIIDELKEEIESKDLCINQLQTRMREIESEREEEALQQAFQIQTNIIEEDAGDPSKRGNSLFSELEERRVRVEDELARLRGRVTRLTIENVDLKASLERGDCRSAIIVTQLQIISKSDAELVQSLKQLKSESNDLFEAYQDRFSALTNEYNRKLLQFRNGLDPNESLEGEAESLRGERDRLFAQKISQDRQLFELRKELKHANHQKIAAEANMKILRVKLQALQDQFSKATEESRYSKNNNRDSDNSFNSSFNSSADNSSSSSRIRNKNFHSKFDETVTETDKDWLHQTILEDTTQQMKTHLPSKHCDNASPSDNLNEGKKSRSEDIPECNQQ